MPGAVDLAIIVCKIKKLLLEPANLKTGLVHFELHSRNLVFYEQEFLVTPFPDSVVKKEIVSYKFHYAESFYTNITYTRQLTICC